MDAIEVVMLQDEDDWSVVAATHVYLALQSGMPGQPLGFTKVIYAMKLPVRCSIGGPQDPQEF